MKSGKRTFVFIEVVLAAMVVILTFAMLHEKYGNDRNKVSVIVRNADDDQWSAFRYGLKMAAKDQNIELFIVATGNHMTAEEQKNLIESEMDGGADAVIVQPVAETDAEKMLKKLQKKIPVMLVEYTTSETDATPAIPTMAPDNYAMGAALAEELLRDYNGRIEGKTIGILAEAGETEALTARMTGFTDVIKDKGSEICWTVLNLPAQDGNDLLGMQESVDFVIALDDSSLTVAGECAAVNELHGALVYGIGHSTEAVYYLDTGFAECLIVPDEFSIGYHSLTEIAGSIGKLFREPKSMTVSYSVIRRDTLFSEENQELIYTMSQ